MWNKLEQWYILPGLSALALIATFHPFNIWPLVFVVLVPLYYFVLSSPERSSLQIFCGGFITGASFAFFLSFITVVQFHWVAEAYLFTGLVHLGFIPMTLLGGLVFGANSFGYRYFSGRGFLLTALAGAALYTASEILLYILCGGYYFALFAYAASPVVPLMSMAALGGTFLVSFILVLINTCIAGALVETSKRRYDFVRPLVLTISVILVAIAGNWVYFHANSGPVVKSVSVAIVQAGSRASIEFGNEDAGAFSDSFLQSWLEDAASTSPDIVIYPFSPVQGAVYSGNKDTFNKDILISSEQSVGEWLGGLVPASTTVMLWIASYQNQQFFDEFQFWKQGVSVAQYHKRDLFPFIDYTPQWAARLGFFTTPVDAMPGPEEQSLFVDGVHIGAALCSEIQDQSLVRQDVQHARLIISAGSEAILDDDEASTYSLKAAQYRAAENNIPVIRANILGPSGIIAPDGSFIAHTQSGSVEVLRGIVQIQPPRRTLFNLLGNLPVIVGFILILVWAWRVKRRTFSLENGI